MYNIKGIFYLLFLFVILSHNKFGCLENVLEDGKCLEDVSLGGTTPTAEPDDIIFEEAKSNLSDDDQSEPPAISESTTKSYQDPMSMEDDLSSRESSRNPTPDCLESLVLESKDNVAKRQDHVESPTSKKETEKFIVVEGLAGQESARIVKEPLEECVVEIQSPQKFKIKGESVLKKLIAKSENDVESPAKKQKDEPVAKKNLEECEDSVESSKRDIIKEKLTEHVSVDKSSTKQQATARETEEEQKDDVESPEKQDAVVDQESGEEQKDNVVLPKLQEEIKYESIVKDELTKHGSDVESATKDQMEDESIDTTVKEKADVLTTDETISQNSRPLLDIKYFESILKGFYKTNNIQIDECKSGDSSSIQPSFMGVVAKFTLIGWKDYTEKFQLHVVVKQLGTNKEHQELYKSKIAAKNEEIAYNTIFPNLNMYGISLPVSICFYADDEQIMVQDLCGVKYNVFEKKKGFISIKESGYVLEALAKFHAATFVLKYKNNDKLQKIKNLTKSILYDGIIKSPLLQHQEDSLRGILSVHTRREESEENVTKVKALKYLIKVAQEDIKDLLFKEQDDYVFCHGDLLLTNFLFKLNNAEQEKTEVSAEMDIKLVDFQSLRFGSVASDLVYLLFVNLQPDDFINNKEDLLRRYFNFLQRNVIDSGVGDNFKLPYEWLEKEIDRFTEYGIIYALWILPMFDKNDNKDQGKEVTQEMLDESSKTIVYNERMRKWVDYYATIYEKKFGK